MKKILLLSLTLLLTSLAAFAQKPFAFHTGDEVVYLTAEQAKPMFMAIFEQQTQEFSKQTPQRVSDVASILSYTFADDALQVVIKFDLDASSLTEAITQQLSQSFADEFREMMVSTTTQEGLFDNESENRRFYNEIGFKVKIKLIDQNDSLITNVLVDKF